MERPTRVKAGAVWYEVVWGDEAFYRTADQSPGQCDFRLQRITVMDGLTPERTACVFAHEVVHAVMHSECWRDSQKDSYTEENVCDIAGYSMVRFWQDNPQVFDWWIGLVKGGER
jgi:hypothetical protein